MNTDKIFAEAIANEYSPKNTSKVVALKNLTEKQREKQTFLLLRLVLLWHLYLVQECAYLWV